ncbi:hypothetical protein ACFX5U_12575 [Sphingobacterium sp. SG20118]|uniref:hypothetical protein n=1 Tax=Sphingobacterium sp. SG20118 TaxID=3367156 RepID=UPI0037DFC865
MAKEISIELQKVEVPLEAKVKTESVLKNYQVLSLPELNFTELVKEMQAPVLLKLRFPDQEFTINLEPNDVKSIDYQSFLNGKELNEDDNRRPS